MGRHYVVSDIHGHLDDLRVGLLEAGLVEDGRWVGGDAELFVLGDLLDRGPDGLGVIDLLRGLEEQVPGRVHVLAGNHEALAVGRALFPASRFGMAWVRNGGLAEDQAGLTGDRLAWLRSLPLMARAGDALLVHSDTVAYADWGRTVDQVNARGRELAASADYADHWELWSVLTGRFDFVGPSGPAAARAMLDLFGGSQIVHGHSVIGSLTGVPSFRVSGVHRYAADLVLAIDGGRYEGGPLLVVPLD